MENDQHIILLFLIKGNQPPPAHYTSSHMGFKAFKTKTPQQIHKYETDISDMTHVEQTRSKILAGGQS